MNHPATPGDSPERGQFALARSGERRVILRRLVGEKDHNEAPSHAASAPDPAGLDFDTARGLVNTEADPKCRETAVAQNLFAIRRDPVDLWR